MLGEKVQQGRLKYGHYVSHHAEQELEAMQKQSVPRLLHICVGRLGREQNIEIGEEQGQPDHNQTDDVGGVPLLDAAPEDCVPGAENPGMKEAWRLHYHEQEDVGQDGDGTRPPNQTYQDVGSLHSANLQVTHREAHSYIALHCHTGQVEGGVEGSADGDDQQEAAERNIDGVEHVADYVQKPRQRQLDHVVENQVDEKVVSRVHPKDLQEIELVHCKQAVTHCKCN